MPTINWKVYLWDILVSGWGWGWGLPVEVKNYTMPIETNIISPWVIETVDYTVI
jgi:hypothetical protein